MAFSTVVLQIFFCFIRDDFVDRVHVDIISTNFSKVFYSADHISLIYLLDKLGMGSAFVMVPLLLDGNLSTYSVFHQKMFKVSSGIPHGIYHHYYLIFLLIQSFSIFPLIVYSFSSTTLNFSSGYF